MSDWKPYAVEAAIGTMKILVQSCQRGYRWRLSTHGTPGTKGDAKQKHGRESIVDRVTCLLTVPEVDQLVSLADRLGPLTWTHPLLNQIDGHIEDLDIPADSAVYGYFVASFNFSEALGAAGQPASRPTPPSAGSAQKKAKGIFDDWSGDLDGLSADIPTGSSGTAFTGAAGNMSAAFGDVDSVFDNITDPDGDGTWRDLSRTLDTFKETASVFINAAQEIEDSVGSLSHSIQTAPLLIQEVVGDAVDNLKSSAGTVASFITTEPSDLYSMMLDAGITMTEETISALMEDNGITDPLFIPAGYTIAIPVAV